MAKLSSTEQRKKITSEIMDKLFGLIQQGLDCDVFFTGENFNTLTFYAGDVDNKETYGSIKFTLHKSNYNLDDEIEKYELFREERELKDKARAEAKAEKLRKAEEKAEKAAQREAAKAQSVEKTRSNIEALKASISE